MAEAMPAIFGLVAKNDDMLRQWSTAQYSCQRSSTTTYCNVM